MQRHLNKSTIILIVVIIATVAFLISCATTIPAGFTCIKVVFGEVQEEPLSEGFHFKFPWESVVKIDNHIKTMRIAAGTPSPTTSDTAETKDQQLIPVFEFEIQYQLNPEKSYFVYRNYGEDYADTLITANALQFIKETFAAYDAEEIVINKGSIPQAIQQKLSAVTDPIGVNIIRINMVTYDFSPEYTQLLEQRSLLNANLQNNKIQQENDRISAQTQYDVAIKQAQQRADSERIAAENKNEIAIAQAKAQAETDKINAENAAFVTITEANAEKEARLAAAEAEKAELEAKASGLNDQIIQQQFINKWDGKLIPSFGNSSDIGFVNYTDIISSYLGMNSGENSANSREKE